MEKRVEFKVPAEEKAGYEASATYDGRESVSSWLRWLARNRMQAQQRTRAKARKGVRP